MISSKPLQYIKGWVEFYKLKFKVTPNVLIPRPETELLVDEVVRWLSNHPERAKRIEGSTPLTILDLGTGAGNIAISLAKNLPHLSHPRGVTILATDISQEALNVAKKNVKLHGVEDKIKFIESNLLSAFCHPERSEGSLTNVSSNTFATLSAGKLRDSSLIAQNDNLIIVTNLPYIPSARIPYLDPSVKNFEPLIALDGGENGFELYRKLFKQIKEGSFHPILIIGEIDYTHGQLAVYEAQKYFPEAEIEVKKDLRSTQRILLIRRFSNRSIQV